MLDSQRSKPPPYKPYKENVISPRNLELMTGQAWRGQGMCTWPSNQEGFRQVDGPSIRRHQGWWVQLCAWTTLLFSCSVVSDSFWPLGLQHTMLSCPSPSPRVCSNSCPLNWWCHPTISSSVSPFSSRLQSFPTSGSFPVSHFFASGVQSIGASASASNFPINIQGWLPLGLTGLISLQSKGLSRVFFSTTVQKHQFFSVQPSLWSNSHIHTWLLGKS